MVKRQTIEITVIVFFRHHLIYSFDEVYDQIEEELFLQYLVQLSYVEKVIAIDDHSLNTGLFEYSITTLFHFNKSEDSFNHEPDFLFSTKRTKRNDITERFNILQSRISIV